MMRRLLSLVLALLVLGALPHARADAKGQTAGPPMDYRKISGLSQPTYRNVIRTTYRIPAADGVQLYIEVTRPRSPKRFPVIAELSPYHGTVYDRDGLRPLPFDGGLVKYFVPRGYAVLMMDLRGTGRSGGCLDLLGPHDRSDIKRVIEWAARQPWSTGRVGTIGHSYPGAAGVAALSQRPKGLVTAVVSAGLSSMYDHQFQAGVPYDALWLGPIEAYYELSLVRALPPGFDLPNEMGRTGDDFGNNVQYTGCGAQSSALTKGGAEFTGQYTPWDAARDFGAAAAQAPVPVFAVHGVNDDAARVIMLDWFLRRNGQVKDAGGAPVQDKLWLGQWTHGVGCCPNQRGKQWTAALHAWMDKYLQQRNVPTGPPVEVFLADGSQGTAVPTGRTQIYTTDVFPGHPRMVDFHPYADGDLSAQNTKPGSVSFFGEPFGSQSATFETPPFDRDVLLTGVPQLSIVASTSMPTGTYLTANLYEQSPKGDQRRLSVFAINTVLRDGLDQVSLVTPGVRYTYHPPGWPMAQNVRKGDRLVLQITTSDLNDKFPFFSIDPNVTVFTGRGGSVLTIPVVDDPVLYPDKLSLK